MLSVTERESGRLRRFLPMLIISTHILEVFFSGVEIIDKEEKS